MTTVEDISVAVRSRVSEDLIALVREVEMPNHMVPPVRAVHMRGALAYLDALATFGKDTAGTQPTPEEFYEQVNALMDTYFHTMLEEMEPAATEETIPTISGVFRRGAQVAQLVIYEIDNAERA